MSKVGSVLSVDDASSSAHIVNIYNINQKKQVHYSKGFIIQKRDNQLLLKRN